MGYDRLDTIPYHTMPCLTTRCTCTLPSALTSTSFAIPLLIIVAMFRPLSLSSERAGREASTDSDKGTQPSSIDCNANPQIQALLASQSRSQVRGGADATKARHLMAPRFFSPTSGKVGTERYLLYRMLTLTSLPQEARYEQA